MCAKFTQMVSGLIPEGKIKEALKGSYYSLYYNAKHGRDNGFSVYYKDGHFEYSFKEGVRFSSYENFSDELKRSLKGYLEDHVLLKGETILDCGAYVGEFTLYAAKAVGPAGRVIAFEPDPGMHKKLIANIELNGCQNVIPINAGVWSSSGAMKFVGDDIKGYSFMSAADDAAAIEVKVVSIDDEMASLGVTNIGFIKMDVEGAELEAVKGARNTLQKLAPDIAIASYHVVDGQKSHVALERLLVSIGYRARTGHDSHLTTYGSKKR